MDIRGEFRKEFWVGVVATVVVIVLVHPLVGFSADAILWLGQHVYEGLSRNIYIGAALGLTEKYSFMTLMMGFSVLMGAFTGISSGLIWKRQGTPPPRIIKWSIAAGSVIFLIFGSLEIGGNFAVLQMNASFNQRMNVLAAHVPDQTLRELRAAWAMMQRRADYVAISGKMDKLARENNIELPAALWD